MLADFVMFHRSKLGYSDSLIQVPPVICTKATVRAQQRGRI